MKFGLALFGLSPRHYPDVARQAEACGFESVWVSEHLVFPLEMPPTYPYSADGLPPVTPSTPLYDPWVVLAAVAAVTTTIRLATNIYVLPLRHPLVTARSLVTLDRISAGRVTLGAGVGWLETEFLASGIGFSDRGRRMDEIIPLLRRLWQEPVIEHRGRFFGFDALRFEPKPVQRPSIPIELGGHSPAALRRAGTLGDGWIEVGSRDIETFRHRLGEVLAARKEAGREREPFEVSAGLGAHPDTLRQLEDCGATRAIVGPTFTRDAPTARRDRISKDDVVAWCSRFADTVISR